MASSNVTPMMTSGARISLPFTPMTLAPISRCLSAILPQEARQRPPDGQDSSDSKDDTWSARTHESPCSYPALDDGTEQGAQQKLYVGGLGDLLTDSRSHWFHIVRPSRRYSCLDTASPDPNQKRACCMLANRNVVVFIQAPGNFSSPQPPAFLDHVLAIMRDNMSFQTAQTSSSAVTFRPTPPTSSDPSDTPRTISSSPSVLPQRRPHRLSPDPGFICEALRPSDDRDAAAL